MGARWDAEELHVPLPAANVQPQDTRFSPHVSKEDSFEPCARPQLEQHLHPWDCLLDTHTKSSSQIRHWTCPYLAHHLCANRTFAGNHQQFSVFLSFFFPPSLQLSLHPASKLAETTVLKSSCKKPAHSTALLRICSLLWFQGKSKGVFAFFLKKSLIYLLFFFCFCCRSCHTQSLAIRVGR